MPEKKSFYDLKNQNNINIYVILNKTYYFARKNFKIEKKNYFNNVVCN